MNGTSDTEVRKPGDTPAVPPVRRPVRETGHSLVALNRQDITVKGVKDVLRFDEESVVLLTVCGVLTLEGRNLKIHVLNISDGIVAVSGTLDGVLYEDDTAAEDSGKSPRSRRFHPFG